MHIYIADFFFYLHYNQAIMKPTLSIPIHVRLRSSGKTNTDDLPEGEGKVKASPVTVLITNKQLKQKLKFGSEFEAFLDARDQVLEHNFDFQVELKAEDFTGDNFEGGKSKLLEDITGHVKKFLVESTSNIVSAAFKFLHKNELTGDEAKEYCAKNLMLNLHSICSQISSELKNSQIFSNIIKQSNKNWEAVFDEIQYFLAAKTENILNNILKNLSDLYPQAKPAGGTPRMRQAIAQINRVEDQESDLIFANGIKIFDEGQKGGDEKDYTPFIMRVINTAINVTQCSKEDSRERTVMEIFTQFNQKLFSITQDEDYQEILKNFNQTKGLEQTSKDRIEHNKKHIIDFFKQTLERNSINLSTIKQKRQAIFEDHLKTSDQGQSPNRQKSEGTRKKLKREEEQESKLLSAIKKAEEQIQNSHKDKNYSLGQKIPAFVKQFSKIEIIKNEFSAKHSSIFRIMTKWAEYLNDILENPNQHIYQRSYPFKSFDNHILNLTYKQKKYLVEQILQQQEQVKYKYQILLRHCYEWIGKLLSEREQNQGFVCRYSDTRALASKIKAVLTHLIINYLNLLIDHLIRAGRGFIATQRYPLGENINLVVFRVSDLMRSKLQCSEKGFISLLQTMYLLDNSKEMQGKFKLVRIKNKLEDPASNIIINYLFMGRVQCELQLSTQSLKEKEQNYFTFSHFIYELNRGKFGTIAEFAIMISQLDPMITASKGPYYSEKQDEPLLPLTSNKENDSFWFQQKVKNPVFECSNCKRLVINQNEDLYRHEQAKRTCKKCFLKNKNPVEHLKNGELSTLIKTCVEEEKSMKRVESYSEFATVSNYQPVLNIDNRGRIDLYLCIYVYDEWRTFLVKVNSAILNNKQLDFTKLDSIDITKKIEKDLVSSKPMLDLWFFVNKFDDQFAQKYIQISTSDESNFNQFVNNFLKFRMQKVLIKNIKFKTDIITTSDSSDKFRQLEDIVNYYGESKDKKIKLKYKKHENLEFSYISSLFVNYARMGEIKPWFDNFLHLKHLKLRGNQISSIESEKIEKNHKNIETLDLSENKLTSITLKQLPELQSLNLKSNTLTSVQLMSMPSLQLLNLQKNSLKSLKLKSLSALKNLELPHEQLQQIKLEELPALQVLDLQYNKLTSIKLEGFSSLKELNLKKNQLTCIELKKLTVLQKVNLSENKLASIQLKELEDLERVDLSHNKLTTIELEHLTSLREMSLNDNLLPSIDLTEVKSLQKLLLRQNRLIQIQIKQLPFLQELDLSYNLLRLVQIANVPNFRTLDLRSNKLVQLKLKQLPALQILDIISNPLQFIEVKSLEALQTMNLSHNKLTSLEIQELPALKTLNLEKNLLVSIQIKTLPALQTLNMSNNKLESIELQSLQALKMLNLQQNRLKQPEIKELPALETLNLSCNQITSIGLKELPSLQILYLRNNKFSAFSLKQLQSLQRLDLSQNKLTLVELERLPALEKLSFRDNELVQIQLKQLQNLQMLDLSSNHLSSVSLSLLPSLKRLSLKSNNFATLELKQLPSLSTLDIDENPLMSIELHQLSALQTLDLFSYHLKQIKLKQLSTLRFLGLDSNKLTSFELKELPALSTLKLRSNQLRSIQLQSLPSLTTLYLQGNLLTSITLESFPALQTINLSYSQIRFIQFKSLSALRTLDLRSKTSLEVVILKDLPELEKLVLQETGATSITLDNIPKLKEAFFSKSKKLETLSLKNLPSLRRLDFEDCPLKNIQTLPSSIEVLWCDLQSILNFDFKELPNLKTLKIQNKEAQRDQFKNLKSETYLMPFNERPRSLSYPF